ncbi:MAG: IS30 family transposase [Thermodesulfobacteriota bacterium]
MRKAKKLSRAERLEIAILLGKKYTFRDIARVLGRSPNTISKEVEKNKTRKGYDPKRANEKARLRLRFRRLQWRKIEEKRELKKYIIERLEAHWNPDEIAGRMKLDKTPFYASKTAMYDWLRSARGQRYCTHLYSKRYRKKKQEKKTKRAMIPNRIDISKRPAGANNRTRYGHWEEDTIVSRKGGNGAAATFSERKSRLVIARKIASLSPYIHAEEVRSVSQKILAKSFTHDNGLENKNHAEYGVPTFFARPYHSWEKGGVENANKMIRRYFPKGTNWRDISQEKLDHIVSIINGKPRKILGYRTALEVAVKAGIIRDMSVLFQG